MRLGSDYVACLNKRNRLLVSGLLNVYIMLTQTLERYLNPDRTILPNRGEIKHSEYVIVNRAYFLT